jgi:1-deoxy-D-xylulose-5-phosphate reductoisomerase
LQGQNKKDLRRIYLTASGGPFREFPYRRLSSVTLKDALGHPRWKMGKKVSVDSATLANKGLEAIEARWLFDVMPSQIKIIIHKEAVIHSMVEFIDGSILAQLAVTDMRIPIQYALSFPQRWPNPLSSLNLLKLKTMSFEEPDFRRFPCLKMALKVNKIGGSLPCVFNAANEEAVEAFLSRRIRFIDIPLIIEKVLEKHKLIPETSLEEILQIDARAREKASYLIRKRWAL